jgi:competence protein ComEA
MRLALAFLLGMATILVGQRGLHLVTDVPRPAVTSQATANAFAPAQLDLNTASATELRQLPGIGPILAGRIVAQRERAGAFRSVSDLRQIAGIGPANLEALGPYLYVSRTTSTGVASNPDSDPPPVAARKGKEPPRAQLDLNRASAVELQELPGIGPVLAERIVADRAARGPFRNVADITRVPGIKSKTLEKLRPHLSVAEPAGTGAARLGT